MTPKNYYKLKLAIYVFTLIAVISIFIGFVYRENGFMHGGYGYSTSLNDIDINKTFTSAIDDIKIDIVSYSIFIEIHDSDEIIVEVDINNSRYTEPLTVNISGDSLKITQIKMNSFNFGHNTFGYGTISIKVPADSIYDYDIDLVSGDVEMYAMGKDVSLDTVSSHVELFAPIEKLDADSVSGIIKVTTDNLSREFRFNTVSGDAYISLQNNTGYTVDFDAVSGSVKDEYNNRTSSRKTHYSYGDGSLKIIVGAVSGKVRLADWQ